MFGPQRVGDEFWLAGDIRAKGFLLGATYGRTTLNGEGLQHQDGHSLLHASTIPTLMAYDPAFAYELAVIIQDGMRRMYEQGEEIFYFITLYNENQSCRPSRLRRRAFSKEWRSAGQSRQETQSAILAAARSSICVARAGDADERHDVSADV
jgi:pyruvate dehydrogenase complex dehydrogenase (E1) component